MGAVEYRTPVWMGLSLRTLSLSVLTVQFSGFILLLHYSRVMPTENGHRYLPSTAVFLVELLKLAICLTIALYQLSNSIPRSTPATSLFGALGSAIFSGDSWKMAVPAGLYTLANSLQYVGISNLDAATYQVIYQLKIIVTAVFSVMMLRKSISSRQWLALVLLMVGVAVVSMPQGEDGPLAVNHHTRVYVPRAAHFKRDIMTIASGLSKLHTRSATYAGIEEDEMALYGPDTSYGLLAAVAVCVCSGFAGVYFEKVIKDSPKQTSLWIRNVQMSLYSLFPAFFIGVLFVDGETVAKHGFFDGYNQVVVLSIMLQSFGGIVVAFCIFYADNISKNFAISISMVLSSLASFFFFDFSASANFIIGTAIVLGSTYLYSLHETTQVPPSPAIQLNSEEKTTIQMPDDRYDTSILLPKTPLKAEDGITTSRPGSPARKKRKSDQVSYFTRIHD